MKKSRYCFLLCFLCQTIESTTVEQQCSCIIVESIKHANKSKLSWQVCEITASDITAQTSESSGSPLYDSSSGSNDVFESPVEVRIYGHKGEIDQTWKTQASVT